MTFFPEVTEKMNGTWNSKVLHNFLPFSVTGHKYFMFKSEAVNIYSSSSHHQKLIGPVHSNRIPKHALLSLSKNKVNGTLSQ